MPRDALWEFIWAAAILLVINRVPVVSTIIRTYWRISAKEIAGSDEKLLKVFVEHVPASAGIGLVEQLLYVYCFTSTHREFIGAVLLFKAFFGWLTIKVADTLNVPATITLQGENADGPLIIKLPAETSGAVEESNLMILARFYSYAIGNFISLAIAILVFEIVHLWGYSFLPYFYIPRA